MATKAMKIGLSSSDKATMKTQVHDEAIAQLITPYSTSSTYAVGDYCSYNGNIYKCTGATSGTWDSTKWSVAALNEVIEDVNDAVDSVDDKANVNGNYPTMTVGVAENLAPYSEDSGAEQSKPFIAQGTGTDNNTAIVTTGKLGLLKEKQGNTLAVNQIVPNGDFSLSAFWSISGGSLSISDGKARASANNDATLVEVYQGELKFIKDHKYLRMVSVKSSVQLDSIQLSGVGVRTTLASNTTGGTYFVIQTAVENQQYFDLYLYKTSFATGDYIDISNCYDVDLTQLFGSNDAIPQDLLDNPSHFSWYYNGSLAYDAGSLQNCNGRYLECGQGRNLFDQECELGKYSDTTGEKQSGTSNLRSKNKFLVVPNKPIYFRSPKAGYFYFYDASNNFVGNLGTSGNTTFTVPANACFMAFYLGSSYGTTYNNDITISLYYTPEQGGEGYDKYYPYVAPKVYDTGNEVLRSAGSVKDTKAPDGTITRNVGVVDLGTLDYTKSTGNTENNVYFQAQYSSIKSPSVNTEKANISCSHYAVGTSTGIYGGTEKNCIAINTGSYIRISDVSKNNLSVADFKTAMSGVMLNYELATPTTEQGTTFPENLEISDYGMMYWLDSNNNLVGIPQGAKFFYPIDTNGFIDDVYSRTNGDASEIALESEITDTALAERGYYKMQDLSSGITDIAGLTYTLKHAYKIGNVVSITVRATNNTGATIRSGTTLFTLASGLIPEGALYVMANIGNSVISSCNIANNGNVAVFGNSIDNGATVAFTLCFAVA